MARQTRRKQTGVIATFLVELSALAGIFGIAQPSVRNNLWQMVQPTTVKSQLNQPPQVTGSSQGLDQYVPQPEPYVPSYVPQAYQPTFPSAYTAQAVLPNGTGGRVNWNPSGYNPMGTYQ